MGYYEQVKQQDLATKIVTWLQAGAFKLRDDGKFAYDSRMSWDSPWHHVRMHPMLKCTLWHQIMFDVISLNLPSNQRFVPSNCHQCYKVVVRPKTLKQLFALLEMQKRLDLPSKCGIERRESVHGLYGGYFYNIGLEAGRECYKKIRGEVDNDQKLGRDITVLLKKACTEYEHEMGPSDKWQITEDQLAIEGLAETLIAQNDVLQRQAEHIQRHIHLKWIEWAYAMGDPTYAEFTDGPLYEPYVTYHED